MGSKVITVITPFYYPEINGVSHVAQKNVEALLDLGFEVNVLTKTTGQAKTQEKVYGFDVEGNGTLFFPIQGDKKKFIEKAISCSEQSELLILHCWHSWSTNLILDNYEKLKSKVYVYSHGTSNKSSRFNLYFILRYINYFFETIRFKNYIKKIDKLIGITTNTNHYRCVDLSIIDSSKKSFLPNPIIGRQVNSADYLAAEQKYSSFFDTELKITFCLSNYEEIKNQKFLIELVNKYPIKLVCVGSKKSLYFQELKDLVAKYNLEDRVLLECNINDSTIEWFFKNSTLFLFGSKNDFSPLVLIESSKYELPFLCFQTADYSREGGFFCKTNEEYEEKLKCLLQDGSDLKKIGLEGKKFYEKNNAFESYKNKLNNIITNENMAN